MLTLNEFSVLCRFEAPDKESAIKELTKFLAEKHRLEAVDEITQSVLHRETLGPTAIGMGCVVPHAKSEHVPEVVGVLAVRQEGIDWGLEEKPQILCLILSPLEGKSADYLKVLSMISIKLRTPEFRQALLEAQDNNQMKEVLEAFTKN